jgi:uncharacterized protein
MNNSRSTSFLMYTAGVFLIVGTLTLVFGAYTLHSRKDPYAFQNSISISGKGEVEAKPTIATFSLTVQETAKTSEEAQKVVSEKVNKVLEGLKTKGVVEADIKTENYSIYPKYEWLQPKEAAVTVEGYYPSEIGNQVQTGFDVSQNVSFKVRNFDTTSDILTLLSSAEVTNLQGPNFEVEDKKSFEEQAQAIAIKDAQAKAEKLAQDLGVKLGKVISFSEDMGYYPEPYMEKTALMAMDAGVSSTPSLPTGQSTITKNISVVYVIE